MGRMANPSEIADVGAFLAGPHSSYVTGQCVVIDGGWAVRGASAVLPGVTSNPLQWWGCSAALPADPSGFPARG